MILVSFKKNSIGIIYRNFKFVKYFMVFFCVFSFYKNCIIYMIVIIFIINIEFI